MRTRNPIAPPSTPLRVSGRSDAGFTLMEVMVSLAIVATSIAAMQFVAIRAIDSAAEANRTRMMNMLLRERASAVLSGVDQGGGGGFDDFPGYEWSVSDTEMSVSEDPPATVRFVTVRVYIPGTAESTSAADNRGEMRISTFADPPDEPLEPVGGGGK